MGLKKMSSALRAKVGATALTDAINLPSFIRRLTYMDLLWSDHQCCVMWEELSYSGAITTGPEFAPGVERQSLWRCEFALDFCQGRWGDHEKFDWTRNSGDIYRALLIEAWRSEALIWASRLEQTKKRVSQIGQPESDPSTLHFAF